MLGFRFLKPLFLKFSMHMPLFPGNHPQAP